jgi:hypothetical protein
LATPHAISLKSYMKDDWMEETHDWDYLSDFCKSCGCARTRAVEDRLVCRRDPNVTPVSHLIAQRRMMALAEAVWKP